MHHTSAQEVVSLWINAVNERRLDDLLALYDSECSLLPTFSPHTLKAETSRRTYFEQLASRPGMEVFLHEKTLRVQAISNGVEIASGIYRFQFAIDDEPLVFEARFSFLVDRNRKAPIMHHHSSQIPRTLS